MKSISGPLYFHSSSDDRNSSDTGKRRSPKQFLHTAGPDNLKDRYHRGKPFCPRTSPSGAAGIELAKEMK